MKKSIKILIGMIFFLAVLSIFSNVKAATASISASKTNINVGDTTKITVSINAATWNLKVDGATSKSFVGLTDSGENEKKTETINFTSNKEGTYTINLSGDISDGTTNETSNVSSSVKVTVSKAANTNNENDKKEQEPTFKTVNEKVYSTSGINVRESSSTDSKSLGQLKAGDSVTRIGTGDNGWSKVTFNGKTGYIRSDLITTQEPAKSTDKALKTLEIKPEGLDPEFDPETTNYTLNVGLDIEQLEIIATPNDDKSKVQIEGNEALQDGDNMVKITVTAEDGTTRIYNIDVKKGEMSALGLTSIKINGYQLSPAFSSNVYEYKINVMDANVNNLDIVALANDEKATVEISGNTALKDGENTVIITVTSENGEEKAVYQIYVNKILMPATNDSKNPMLYVIIGIGAIVFIAIIISIIKIRKNRKFEQTDNYEDLYGYSSKGQDTYNEKYSKNENIEDQIEKKVIGNFDNLVNENLNNLNVKAESFDETKIIDTNMQDIKNDIFNPQPNGEIQNVNPYVNKNVYGEFNYNLDNNIVQEPLYKNVYNNDGAIDQAKSLIQNPTDVVDDYYVDDDFKARKRGKHSK